MTATHAIVGIFACPVLVAVLMGMRGHTAQGDGPYETATADDAYVRLPCKGPTCRATTRHMLTGDGTGAAICRECGALRTG